MVCTRNKQRATNQILAFVQKQWHRIIIHILTAFFYRLAVTTYEFPGGQRRVSNILTFAQRGLLKPAVSEGDVLQLFLSFSCSFSLVLCEIIAAPPLHLSLSLPLQILHMLLKAETAVLYNTRIDACINTSRLRDNI